MNPMNDTSSRSGAAPPDAGANMRIDDKVVKKMAAEAIRRVDGVLGLEANLSDMLLSNDTARGVSVGTLDGGKIQISARIITEYGKNIPAIVAAVTANVTDALQGMAGLDVDKVDIEVSDTMSRDEYAAKYSKNSGMPQ